MTLAVGRAVRIGGSDACPQLREEIRHALAGAGRPPRWSDRRGPLRFELGAQRARQVDELARATAVGEASGRHRTLGHLGLRGLHSRHPDWGERHAAMPGDATEPRARRSARRRAQRVREVDRGLSVPPPQAEGLQNFGEVFMTAGSEAPAALRSCSLRSPVSFSAASVSAVMICRASRSVSPGQAPTRRNPFSVTPVTSQPPPNDPRRPPSVVIRPASARRRTERCPHSGSSPNAS